MTSVTVSNENGRVAVPSLPLLNAPASGDRVVGVQGGAVGLFDAGAFVSSTALSSAQETLQAAIDAEAKARQQAIFALPPPPDLMPYAKVADVAQELDAQEEAWQKAVAAVRGAIPDVSGFATTQAMTAAVAAEAQARQQAIAAIPSPDLSGLATKQALADEVTARERAIAAIPKPDLSGFVTAPALNTRVSGLVNELGLVTNESASEILAGYAYKSDLNGLVSTTALTNALSGYVTTQMLASYPTTAQMQAAIAAIPKPDLSGYATTDDLQSAILSLPPVPDVSQFVTSQQVGTQITQAIKGLNIPSVAGLVNAQQVAAQISEATGSLAKESDLTAETTARQQGDSNLADSINAVGASVDKLTANMATMITGAVGSTGKPLYVQRFTVTTQHGQYVSFPAQFASADVYVIVPAFFDGVNMIVSGPEPKQPVTAAGFTLASYWLGTGGSGIAPSYSYQVIAIGERDSTTGGGSGTGGTDGASIVGYGYYNDGQSQTFVRKPIYQMFLTFRSSGGSGNQQTMTYPDGFEFLDVPHVSVQGCDLSASDFASGAAASPIDGTQGGAPGWVNVTKTALSFNHATGWPGWWTEVMTFVLTGFRKE